MNKIKYFLFSLVKWTVLHLFSSGKMRDLLMWPITSRLLGKDYSKVKKLKSGIVMHSYLGDQLGRMQLFYGEKYQYFWEPTTVRIIEKLVPKTKEVLIAGSHIGLLVLYARKVMEISDSRVHTFEPVSELNKISQSNFDLNIDLGKVILNKEGLSDYNGKSYIVSDTLRSHLVDKLDKNTEEVSLITIDSYLLNKNIDNLDFILLDVEGLEYEVFQGANNLFDKKPPQDIIFEISPRILGNLNKSDRVVNFFKNKGYNLYIINDDYSLKKNNHKNVKIEIFYYDDYYTKFRNKDYFNVYATKRVRDDFVKLNINII